MSIQTTLSRRYAAIQSLVDENAATFDELVASASVVKIWATENISHIFAGVDAVSNDDAAVLIELALQQGNGKFLKEG